MTVEACFDVIDGGFVDAPFGIVYDFQKPGGVLVCCALLCHGVNRSSGTAILSNVFIECLAAEANRNPIPQPAAALRAKVDGPFEPDPSSFCRSDSQPLTVGFLKVGELKGLETALCGPHRKQHDSFAANGAFTDA